LADAKGAAARSTAVSANFSVFFMIFEIFYG